MLIRFRSKDGMHRVSCEASDIFGSVLEKLLPQLDSLADPTTFTVSDKPGNGGESVGSQIEKTVESIGLKHGDIVYVNYTSKGNNQVDDPNRTASVIIKTSGNIAPANIKELPIDEELGKETGSIIRERSQFCKHGDKGMCEYCSPLPPWDKGYHEDHNIKHISFHSYLNKLNETTNKKESGSSYIAPLSQPKFKIDLHCTNGHEPWPRGICSKCQPSAITLQQQEFRMVDHVEFQKSELINEFIEAWRYTGMQRIGYMYGTYEKYDATPLGIKAVVEAIYEPPQHDEPDGLTYEVDQVAEEINKIDEMASKMGLLPVGVIFTDLTDAGNGDGSVFCKRHKDSFFLSSFEVIMAAKYQLSHPNVCKYSNESIFSSKFVTCVVSGNLESEIDIACYQVSTDGEALVDATMITGSTHPSMAYINDTTNQRYVPEIFYMKKNEYNLTIKENAKPAFPIDYLLVSLSHGFPTTTATGNGSENESKSESDAPVVSNSKFATVNGFPWTNRQAMGQSQDYQELKKYIYPAAVGGDFNLLREKVSNFHFLLYVYTLQILSDQQWLLLVQAATTQDYEEPLLQVTSTPEWQTLVMILQETA